MRCWRSGRVLHTRATAAYSAPAAGIPPPAPPMQEAAGAVAPSEPLVPGLYAGGRRGHTCMRRAFIIGGARDGRVLRHARGATIGASGLSIAALGSSCAVFPLCCRYSPEAHWWSVRRRAGRPFRCVSLQLHWRLKRQARLHQVTGSCVASHGSCHAGACAMVLTVVFG